MNPDNVNADDRHSRAQDAELIVDPGERAKQEARNGLRQFDEIIEIIEYLLQPDHPFKLRPSVLLRLNRTALVGINSYAGNWRPGAVEIEGSKHRPPDAIIVPELTEEMCDYVNDSWSRSSPVHLAAYSLWRTNWIHPFADGNGRTARAISYVLLCVRLGYRLPGTKTIPELISENKKPYYAALEVADTAFGSGKIDVSEMESLLGDYLAAQLLSVVRQATSPGGVSELNA
jgi:Fic family protein